MTYDVIVVGARVAGAALAALLAEQGIRVLLLDKARFPSDTLSTHFFRSPALKVFERLGVLGEVNAAAPPMTVMWNYIDGHVLRDPIESPDAHLQYFLCERRITLDDILFRRVAREENVDVRQGAQVKELLRQNGHVTGVRWCEDDGVHEATARAVVGADGFYSTIAKAVEPAYEDQHPVTRCMYYTYYHGIEPLEEATLAEHHFAGDSLTYVFPTDGDLTLVAVSMPVSEFPAFKKEPLARLRSHLDSLPLLKPRLKKAEITADVRGSGNIPCYQRKPYGPGWALVGDAHQVLDPWSGMGIDHATTHASMLAGSLLRFLTEQASWEDAMGAYHREARAWSEKTYRRTSTHAKDLRVMTQGALKKRGLV